MGLKTYRKLNKTLVYGKAFGVTSAKASEVPDNEDFGGFISHDNQKVKSQTGVFKNRLRNQKGRIYI